MLNKEIIQRFHSLHSHGVQSDNTRLTNRHIYSVICGIRSRLLSQEFKKGQKVSDWAYQSLDCLELIKVPKGEHPLMLELGCWVMRSKYKIPAILLNASKYIMTVTGPDSDLSIGQIDLSTQKYNKGRRFTKSLPEFYIDKGYLYISSSTIHLEDVQVSAIFENPILASTYKTPCNTVDKCKSYLDYDFPYEEDLVDGLVKLASEEIIQMFSQTKQDITNDSVDN